MATASVLCIVVQVLRLNVVATRDSKGCCLHWQQQCNGR
jgi:hypothetical protein